MLRVFDLQEGDLFMSRGFFAIRVEHNLRHKSMEPQLNNVTQLFQLRHDLHTESDAFLVSLYYTRGLFLALAPRRRV